jgi:Chaperone for flagella basal body P-ring formation
MCKGRIISFRILAVLTVAIYGFLLCVCSAIEASDVIHAMPRVSLEQVRQAIIVELRSRTIANEQFPSVDDIELPLAVPMRSGSSVRVSSVCWDRAAERTRFQLECTHPGECLPFLAYVRTASRANAPACRAESRDAARLSSEFLIHAGERATAVLNGAGIRINAPVTCLQGGDPGAIIRVRQGEGHIFRARIIGPSRVDANLE